MTTTPIAVVEIELIEVTNLPAAATAGAGRLGSGAFIVARIFMEGADGSGRFIGRSDPPLGEGSTFYDFSAEAGRWRHAMRFEGSKFAFVRVEVFQDRDLESAVTTLTISGVSVVNAAQSATEEVTVTVEGATLRYRVTVRSTVAGALSPPRGSSSSTPSRVQVGPALPVVLVNITDAQGVYEAGAHATPVPPEITHSFTRPRRSGFRDDGLGRVYLNRDPQGHWESKRQYIDLTAELEVVSGTLPMDAKIQWRVRVPDDPIREHPQVRSEAIAAMRAPHHDRDFHSTAPTGGPHWTGNLGRSNPTPRAQQAWEQIGTHALSDVELMAVKTTLEGTRASVRLHCPNQAGDRFIVEATVVSASEMRVVEDFTGLLTMWHRLVAEYRPIPGAYDLSRSFQGSLRGFAPCCVHLDYIRLDERPIPPLSYAENTSSTASRDTPARTQPPARAPSDWRASEHLAFNAGRDLDRASTAFISDRGMFPRRLQPGIFALASANLPNPFPAKAYGGARRGWRGQARLVPSGADAALLLPALTPPIVDPTARAAAEKRHEILDRQLIDAARIAAIKWGNQSLGFSITAKRRIHDRTLCVLSVQDITATFDSSNGNIDRLTRRERFFTALDYGLGGDVRCGIAEPGGAGFDGISPDLRNHFSGGLIIFTHHPVYMVDGHESRDFVGAVVNVICHEFGHSIGTPHKCGHFEYRHDSGQSCTMNYGDHGVHRNGAFVPDTVGIDGASFCGMHIAQMRKVFLQDNSAFHGW